MRKNCQRVAEAFDRGLSERAADSIWTNGEAIYSYQTCLACRLPDGTIAINTTKYSTTTSNHQNSLRRLYIGRALHVDGLSRGACRDTLAENAALLRAYRR